MRDDDRAFRQGLVRLDKLYPSEDAESADRSLSRTLAVKLAVAAMHDNKATIMKVALSDSDHHAYFEQDLDFQRAYQESRDDKMNSEAVDAVDAAGLNWCRKEEKFDVDAWLDDHRY